MPRIFGLRVVGVRWARLIAVCASCALALALVSARQQELRAEREVTALEARLQSVEQELAQEGERHRVESEARVRALEQSIQSQRETERDLGILRQRYDWICGVLGAIPGSENLQWEPLSWQVPGPPVPAIDGRVVAVKNDVEPALVLLSVGQEDQVEAGFRFSIYRDSIFLGKVVVERVLRDSAGCRVLFTVEGEQLLAGDAAATRIP